MAVTTKEGCVTKPRTEATIGPVGVFRVFGAVRVASSLTQVTRAHGILQRLPPRQLQCLHLFPHQHPRHSPLMHPLPRPLLILAMMTRTVAIKASVVFATRRMMAAMDGLAVVRRLTGAALVAIPLTPATLVLQSLPHLLLFRHLCRRPLPLLTPLQRPRPFPHQHRRHSPLMHPLPRPLLILVTTARTIAMQTLVVCVSKNQV